MMMLAKAAVALMMVLYAATRVVMPRLVLRVTAPPPR